MSQLNCKFISLAINNIRNVYYYFFCKKIKCANIKCISEFYIDSSHICYNNNMPVYCSPTCFEVL